MRLDCARVVCKPRHGTAFSSRSSTLALHCPCQSSGASAASCLPRSAAAKRGEARRGAQRVPILQRSNRHAGSQPSCRTLTILCAGLAAGDRAHRSAPAPRARASASHPSAEADHNREVLCNPPGRVRRRRLLRCSTLAARRPGRRARAERGRRPRAAPLGYMMHGTMPRGRAYGILRPRAIQPAGRQRLHVPAGPPAEARVSSRTRLLQPCRAAVPGLCARRASRVARRVYAARLPPS